MSVISLVPHDPTWSQQFETESQKILGALGGWAWEGGVVYLLEHVGSTSIPGIMAKPCIDMALGVYPFPLEASAMQALETLGYTYRGENGIAGRQYFQRGPHDFHLHVYEAGGDLVTNHVLFRGYLRANHEARKSYEQMKLELAKHHLFNSFYKKPMLGTSKKRGLSLLRLCNENLGLQTFPGVLLVAGP
jgi:GrpB-like predicted nucleotidyltransferase (UPF0157 family)